MPLMLAPQNQELTIRKLLGNDKTSRHLQELGLVPGRSIRILGHEAGGLIIKIDETRLAIDRKIALLVEVEPLS